MSQVTLFGCVIPGRPLINEFIAINEFKCVTDIIYPNTISEITFFININMNNMNNINNIIPIGYGIVLYYSIYPYTNWVIIGSIQPEKPSGIFHTGWSNNEELRNCPLLKLCVSLESLDTIKNLDLVSSGVADRFAYAQKVAKDLFQYMCSFSTSTQISSNGEMMLVPTKILDMWMERFTRKYQLDPNFLMKSSS